MKKTYHGSCHCGAVAFEADFDLATETSRCNCSMCSKLRLWKASVDPAHFRMLKGEDAMNEYRFGSHAIQHQFCRTCGVKMFGHGERESRPFIVISIATLDDAADSELAAAKITYIDGRHDAFDRAPREVRHL